MKILEELVIVGIGLCSWWGFWLCYYMIKEIRKQKELDKLDKTKDTRANSGKPDE